MTITIYDQLEQHTDEWYEARRGIITASVIGKLITPTLKTANNDTSRGIVYTLAAERITGHVEHIHPSFDMMRGTDDEPYARDAYAEHHAPVEEVGFIRLDGDGYSIGYSPDGLVGDDGLIEIKSRNPKAHIKTILDGAPPAENMAQLQTGLLVTGRAWIDYVSFCQGMPLYVTRVTPHSAWQAAIKEAACDFEENVREVLSEYHALTTGLTVMERRPDLYNTELTL
jgi:hypothetical protein